MKFKFMSLAAMAACVAFTACSNDDEPGGSSKPDVALKGVNVGINTIDSRAGITATAFSGSESIGIFLHGGEGIDDAVNGRYNIGSNANLVEPLNVKYDRNATEDWWTSQNPIILSSKLGKMYAYYPYAEGNNDGKTIPVVVNQAQGSGISAGTVDATEQTDFMYADVVSNISNAIDFLTPGNTVTFKMNHALAMVTFRFQRDTYPGEGVIQRIELKNAAGKEYILVGDGTMHIGTGTITVTGNAGSVYCTPNVSLVDVALDNGADPALPHMLIYPTANNIAADDCVLSITMDNKTYEIPVPDMLKSSANYKFEAGKNYVYTMKLTGYGFGADDEDGRDDITVEIKPWVEQEVTEGSLVKPVA